MTSAVQTIRLEHFNIGSVLFSLRYLIEQIEQGRWEPDFTLLSVILEYMERFPEVLHHPKEEDYLFRAMQRRKPELAGLLGLVHDEHVKGARMLRDLRDALGCYESNPEGFEAFRDRALAYIEFERRHMAREERELLPMALDLLQEEDWREIDAAFAANDDPLFGAARRKEFERLTQHILNLAPTPLGFRERRAAAG